MAERIQLTDPQAVAFARIAQHALVNGNTVFPGGYRPPPGEWMIVGAELVPTTEAEWRRQREAPDPREDDPSREGIFRSHNCWKCQNGSKPCVRGATNRCDYPRARND